MLFRRNGCIRLDVPETIYDFVHRGRWCRRFLNLYRRILFLFQNGLSSIAEAINRKSNSRFSHPGIDRQFFEFQC